MLLKKDIYPAQDLLGSIPSTKCLSPRPGTLLAGLVSSINGRDGLFETTMEEVVQNSGETSSVNGTHEEIQADAVRVVYGIMANINHVAKNVINPMTISVLEAITEEQRVLAEETSRIATIIQVEPPELINSESYHALINNYRESPITVSWQVVQSAVELVKAYPSDEELIKAIKTGSASMDKLLNFDGVSLAGAIEEGLQLLTSTDSGRYSGNELQSLIMTFNFYHGIANGKGPGAVVTSENSALAEAAALCMAAAGRQLKELIANYKYALDEGYVIAPINLYKSGDRRVYVLGPNYRKWCQEGHGTPETILGWSLRHPHGDGVIDVLDPEHCKLYTKRYAEFQEYASTKMQLSLRENMQKVTLRVLSAYIFENQEYDTNGKKILQDKLIEACVPSLGMTARQYVQRIVAQVFTDCPDALLLLQEMDVVLESMRDVEMSDEDKIKRARDIANCVLVGRWLGDQIAVI